MNKYTQDLENKPSYDKVRSIKFAATDNEKLYLNYVTWPLLITFYHSHMAIVNCPYHASKYASMKNGKVDNVQIAFCL